MANTSITDFLSLYSENFNPKLLSKSQLKDLNDIMYIRSISLGTKYFLFFNEGIISLLDVNNNSLPLSRFIRNEFHDIFKDLFILLDNRVCEVIVSTDVANSIFIQDIFNLNQENPFDVSKIRFNLLHKLFRETKKSQFFSFNLPSIQFVSLYIEKVEEDKSYANNKELFLFNTNYKIELLTS